MAVTLAAVGTVIVGAAIVGSSGYGIYTSEKERKKAKKLEKKDDEKFKLAQDNATKYQNISVLIAIVGIILSIITIVIMTRRGG